MEIVAKGSSVVIMDHKRGSRRSLTIEDPMQVPIDYSAGWRPAPVEGLPNVFTGGWVGYTGYDTVRYVYSGGCAGVLRCAVCGFPGSHGRCLEWMGGVVCAGAAVHGIAEEKRRHAWSRMARLQVDLGATLLDDRLRAAIR